MQSKYYLRSETRSDNPDLRGYTIYLDDKKYIMYYEKDLLREVYFISNFKDYFMSCRTDFKTISHYYIVHKSGENSIIKRYENGVHNRTYTIESSNITTCFVDGIKRVYSAGWYEGDEFLRNKLHTDLVSFLTQFTALGLDKLASPQEPAE